MEGLKDFTQKDMIEQITILDEIKESRQVEALPQLFELYGNPLGDQAVNEMVYHTLFDLLAGQEKYIVEGLKNDSREVRLLCIRRAGEEAAEELKPALLDLLKTTEEPELLSEVIRALDKYRDPGLIETLLPYLQHEDYPVVAWTMHVLVDAADNKVRDALKDMVETSGEMKDAAGGCDLRTALAIENLAKFRDEQTIQLLINHIHHPNPSFRRVVLTALASMGEEVLPALESCLDNGNRDEKIMAANIIGLSGDKKGADILVAHLEEAEEPNLRFAIYESLGRINSLRSVIGLSDGLAEQDELSLMAVITSMDNLCNPGIVKVLNESLDKKDSQSDRIAKAIITVHAGNLFAALYQNGQHAETLIQALSKYGDQEAVEAFRGQLTAIEGDKAAADLKRLQVKDTGKSEKRILAADDSKAMLFFYKGAAKDLGMELVTVEDGKQAFEYLQSDSDFDLIITDMNMPNMDGIELTREIRKQEEWAKLPILMASTESEKSQSDLASQAGVTDFITKPFSKEDFKAKIEQMFR